MKTSMIIMTWLAAATAHPVPPPTQTLDRSALHVQVILDKLGISPSVLDGKGGRSLVAALTGFQEARGLPTTSNTDAATLRALYPYRNWRPTVTLVLDAATLAGPFTNPLPSEPADQAKLPALGYRNVMESLAERFHTTTDTLIALNSPDTKLAPGTKIVFPNALPTSRSYTAGDAAWKATLNALNLDAGAPKADHIVVDKSEGVLKAYDANDRLMGQFSATMGSEHDPLPIGTWKILGLSTNPKFHYNPALFWDAKPGDEKATLPPGPNNPVGAVWIDISKPHYGIHGTPEPSKIGRTESHSCICLTKWDAGRLALMVKAGVPAIFEP